MKKIFSVAVLFALSCAVHAIPAKRGQWKNLTLADGTTVRAELRGDEFMSYWRTEGGQTFVLDAEKGCYTSADLKKLMEEGDAKRTEANARRIARRKVNRIGGDHIEYTGKRRGLIILTEFADKKFGITRKPAFYKDIANADEMPENRKRLGFKGSVKKYFFDQSRGLFDLEFDVVGPVTVPNKYAYYGAHSGNSNDIRPGTMVAEACQLAANELKNLGIDMSTYDWNGDGYVDQVFVLYAGRGEAAGGDENTIWPHEHSLEASDFGRALIINGIAFNTYACGSELTFDRLGRDRADGIGTICHEFSHCLGLPDFYDTQGGNYGMFTWDLMDQGSYNGDSYSPAAYTTYERDYAGWAKPIELKEPTTVKNMWPIDDGGVSFIIYNDGHPDEAYLLENRQLVNWDEGLYGKGLLIVHLDYIPGAWRGNAVNSTTRYYYENGQYVLNDHQLCTPIAADNDYAMAYPEMGGNDVYPYKGNNELTNTSTPAAILYNANTDGSMFMNKPITNIVQNDNGSISFDFMGGSDTNIIDGIQPLVADVPADGITRVYDALGRMVYQAPTARFSVSDIAARGMIIIKDAKGARKIMR